MEIDGFATSYNYSSAVGETSREVSSESSQETSSQESQSNDTGNNVDVKA